MNEKLNCTIRIQKIELLNFKNVEHGSIVFNCGKKFIPFGTESDILGIYGQNGSGKTTLIESLTIIKSLLCGEQLPSNYSNCVAAGKDHAEIEYTFDCQYPNGDVCKYIYKVCLKCKTIEDNQNTDEMLVLANEEIKSSVLIVYDEKLSVAGIVNGHKYNQQALVDTSTTDIPFGPEKKLKALIDKDEYSETVMQLNFEKQIVQKRAQSFIFRKEFRCSLDSRCCETEEILYRVINDLYTYAQSYLFILDTKFTGEIRLNSSLPIYTQSGVAKLGADKPSTIAESFLPELTNTMDNMNIALSQLIPGMNIKLAEIGQRMLPNGNIGRVVELISERNGQIFPLRDESDGIRKLVSCMQLIITAYNNPSVTVAIDEFDSGVFEYLLGEILIIFEETGLGQFIFTSHNLRPLEVINKKYLYFTTTNPENRYVHLKNIGSTNNLRDVYYREILLGNQSEELYKKTKRYRMAAAFRKAGESIEV